VFVVEQNRDAQLRALLTMETAVDKQKLRSILHYDGLPMSANVVVEGVEKALARGVAA
jgi:2-oxoglutarate ferredoxin oxidoreductase subunit alpha